MKRFGLTLIGFVLIGPMGAIADNDNPSQEWLSCHDDAECVLAPTNGCGILLGVNKRYFDQVHKLALSCRAIAVHPLNFSVRCIKNECSVGAPDESGAWKSMPQDLVFIER